MLMCTVAAVRMARNVMHPELEQQENAEFRSSLKLSPSKAGAGRLSITRAALRVRRFTVRHVQNQGRLACRDPNHLECQLIQVAKARCTVAFPAKP